MAYYLQMDGVDDFIYTPLLTYDRIVLDCSVDSTSANTNLYLVSSNGGTYVDATTMNQAFSYVQKSNMTIFRNSYLSMKIDGGTSVSSAVLVSNQRYVIDYGVNRVNDPATEIFSNNTRSNISKTKGRIYNVKFYDGLTLVAHYDLTLGDQLTNGTIKDETGNGNHATLTGGTWVQDGPTWTDVSYPYATKQSIYADRSTLHALKQSIYADRSYQNPTNQAFYAERSAEFPTKQAMFKDVAFSYATKQAIYQEVSAQFAMQQNIYSDYVLFSASFPLKQIIYADRSVPFAMKQAIYADKTYVFATTQRFYDPSLTIIGTVQLEGKRELYVYLVGKSELNVSLKGGLN